ncbi:hypothetical protein, partial [Sulfurimonas sp.]|uniref:hypothetical protein n=1 Tax=Sulfurimonas sp. TaxID=2022749 RepID=UPI003D102A3D
EIYFLFIFLLNNCQLWQDSARSLSFLFYFTRLCLPFLSFLFAFTYWGCGICWKELVGLNDGRVGIWRTWKELKQNL